MSMRTCDVVIPCRDEALALPIVLADVPEGWHVIVVDNGSTDGTADVARSLGATVVHESHVAVIDGDASMRLTDLVPMLDVVLSGAATMAIGRRRPTGRGVWPWHARAGTLALATMIRRRSGFGIHDLAPMRVCRRDDLLALGVEDRRFGYPLELMLKAAAAGWTVHELDVPYGRRAAGTRSKVSGSVRGTARVVHDFAGVLR